MWLIKLLVSADDDDSDDEDDEDDARNQMRERGKWFPNSFVFQAQCH